MASLAVVGEGLTTSGFAVPGFAGFAGFASVLAGALGTLTTGVCGSDFGIGRGVLKYDLEYWASARFVDDTVRMSKRLLDMAPTIDPDAQKQKLIWLVTHRGGVVPKISRGYHPTASTATIDVFFL